MYRITSFEIFLRNHEETNFENFNTASLEQLNFQIEQVKKYLKSNSYISAYKAINSEFSPIEKEKKLKKVLLKKTETREKLDRINYIEELMGIEGNIRKKYYEAWNNIVKQDINFTKRIKNPPENMINTLLSFANSLVYTTALSEIYKTQLNPTVSYLHEPGTSRYSLSLDIAEIFKPLIAERMIFSLLNKNMISESDFERESNYLYLKESARKTIVEEYDKRLQRTIRHKGLNRDVSYRYLFRLECYKLIKHLTDEKEYEGFKIWW